MLSWGSRATRPLRPASVRGTLLLLLAVLVVPVLVVQALVYHWRFETRRHEEYRTNLELARGVARAFDMYVRDVLHQEGTIARALTSELPGASREAAITLLAASVDEHPSVIRYVWIDGGGRVVATGGPLAPGRERGLRAVVDGIARGRPWAVSDLMRDDAGQPFFIIARGLREGGGALRGIVAAFVDPQRLGGELAIPRGGGGAVAIIDRAGRGVYRYPEVDMTWEQRDWRATQPIIGAALEGGEVTGTFVSVLDGRVRMSGLTPIGSLGWVAGANRPQADVLGPVRQTMLRQFGVLTLAIAVAVILALVLARTLTRSIGRLREHALAVGRGELGRALAIDHPAELAAAGDAFNLMADEIQRRDAERQRLLATIAHELRNPLAPLRHNVRVLQRSPRGPEADRALAAIDRQVTQLSRLIEDLLDVHRVATGKLTLAPERVDLAAIVRATAEDLRALYAARELTLEVDTGEGPVYVDADPARLAQIIANLLQNSGKFTPRGGWARVGVSVERPQAVLRVTDSGIGLAPDARARLFHPFAQLAPESGPARGRGLGLGLALVKSLVELHGGTVEAQSEGPGTGAQFTIRLPLAPDDGRRPSGAGSSRPGEPAPHLAPGRQT